MRSLSVVGLLISLLLRTTAFASSSGAWQPVPEPSPDREDLNEDQLLKIAGRIRGLHEGALFLLRGYGTLQAEVAALENGEPANRAFWIGASSMLPGTGQLINGEYPLGGVMLFAGSLSLSGLGQAVIRHPEPERQPAATVWYQVVEGARQTLLFSAMLQAANANYFDQRNRSQAIWTGAASILPGVGQAINGDWWEAAAFFSSWVLLSIVSTELEPGSAKRNVAESNWTRQPSDPQLRLAFLGTQGVFLEVRTPWP